jgi:fructose-1,6-bisphosphatase/inositol monophosphatase family enzyme
VIDLSDYTVYWSVGEGKIFAADKLYDTTKKVPGTVIDVDLGSTYDVDPANKARHARALDYLQTNADYSLISLNTSLCVLYAALHKLDGVVCIYTNPWDAAAGIFLAMQSGGKATTFAGTPWKPSWEGYILTFNGEVHQTLLKAMNQ